MLFQQDESTQRYQEGLKHIREKAFEMSVLRHSTEDHNEAPQITPYDNKKMCTICNAIVSLNLKGNCSFARETTRSQGYKTFFMLNSTEQAIYLAHKFLNANSCWHFNIH